MKSALPFIAAAAIVAFAGAANAGGATSRYSCDGGAYTFSLSAVSNNEVKLVDGAGNTTVLKRARTGSGERFTGGDYDLSMKGASAMISIAGGAELTDCSLVETSSARPAAATNYTCDDGGYSFSLAPLSGGRVKFTDGAGNSATLKAAGSASGERWVGGDYEVSLKGGEGMVTVEKRYNHTGCTIN